jgi:hypothetical protein
MLLFYCKQKQLISKGGKNFMRTIEKTELIESEIFFDAEEVTALETVKKMFTTFHEIMENISDHSGYISAFVKTRSCQSFDEEQISDFLDTLETFCRYASVTISGEG